MLDETDLKIISELCRNARGSFRQLADRVGVHPSTLISRVGRLEKEGVIKGYTARLDLEKLGYDFMAIVELTIPKKLLEIQHRLRSLPGVVAIFDVTGDTDSVLLIACENTRAFNKTIKKIHEIPEVQRTNSHVVLNVIKDWSDFVPV
ncbi:MAG: Lrp/AsnC family transcriptional regulator [Candidatus Micrarchaeia archaeon]